MTDELAGDDALELARLRRRAPGEYLLRRLGDQNRDSIVAAIANDVPVESLVVTARWWQLETYLRLLVYIQLRALLGPDWQTPLTPRTISRADQAKSFGYMASPDDRHLFAHLDVGRLFELIDSCWEQCADGIGLPKTVWQGRVDELRPIRHRVAHCRRPHADDVDRIEQLLRDLEPAANRALRNYVNWRDVDSDLMDPVVEDWIGLRHPVARRLVEHGVRNKGIQFNLLACRLAWAEESDVISGTPGWFWVMHAALHGRHLYIDDYWSRPRVQALLPMVGHIIQSSSWSLAVTIPAVGDPAAISDAIGGLFEAVFEAAGGGDADRVRHPWRRSDPELDPRVDAEGLLSVLSGLNHDDPLSLFSAQ